MMTKRNIWYIQYSKSHDLYGIIPCKSMYATLHFDIKVNTIDPLICPISRVALVKAAAAKIGKPPPDRRNKLRTVTKVHQWISIYVVGIYITPGVSPHIR
ncbi:hypothetical protein ACN38_g10256 [Penicillium nordicum]|uniref:Uncharacterized protein n=1 Tax=Penicillium nordicum TaxID=229535 RepID=A0A0M9WBU1_9EURO|nr:hypothetical protein ACN38_g10256 [Penicillium nordicum]